jgi:N-hydroxyarylamine O-acetyltransferase
LIAAGFLRADAPAMPDAIDGGGTMSTHMPGAGDALRTYLAHIGYRGEPTPDLATLTDLSRLHMAAFAYENIDVQLGRRVTRDPRAAFAKMVGDGRGGWCFEYNGLFAWMLELAGFRVLHLAGAVMREAGGDKMVGNHLVPLVVLDRLYLADVAMGVLPVPLVEGPIEQGWRRYALERAGEGWWRFRNHPGALPPSFDFSLDCQDRALLDAQSEWLQTDPASPFVRNAILQRFLPDRIETLVGRLHSIIDVAGERVVEIDTRDGYGKVVRENFGVYVPDLAALWARVSQSPGTGFLEGLGEAA